MMSASDSGSTRPYLIRALYEWCTDNGFTPYVAVLVDDSVRVPREYVKNGEIVLNISFDATSSLKLGNEFIEFKARFAGTPREILVPVSNVVAIYARENGQGMAFPMPVAAVGNQDRIRVPSEGEQTETSETNVVHLVNSEVEDDATDLDPEPPKPPSGSRPMLKRIK
jgi:stringent starvation protein B